MNLMRTVILLSFILIVFSCKKKDSQSVLGLDVQPDNDLLGITISDSASIFMHTQKVDSVRTYNEQYKYLGSVQDAEFGANHASIYTNFSIANSLTNVSFGTNPVLDSAEIVLRFSSDYIGDLSTHLTYDVYLLNELIQTNVSYYTNQHFSKTKISTTQTQLVARNGVLCLVLPFDANLAQYILRNTNNLTNNTAFLNAYKGLYITTSDNSSISPVARGSIRRYDLDDDLSGINMYYHDGGSISSKGKVAQFTFKSADALRLNHIDHNYTVGAANSLYQQVIAKDSIQGNNSVYLNSFGGTRVRVYLPFLKAFSDSEHVSISRAELILKVDRTGYNSMFTPPDNLALIGCNSSGTEELLYDQLLAGDLTKYDGSYDSTNKQYVFNIARQMQKIITDKTYNYGFYLVNALQSPSYAAKRDNRLNRVFFGGKNSTTYKPVFKVTYIKFPYDK